MLQQGRTTTCPARDATARQPPIVSAIKAKRNSSVGSTSAGYLAQSGPNIEADLVDVIVVYKIVRLSRSLMDPAKLIIRP